MTRAEHTRISDREQRVDQPSSVPLVDRTQAGRIYDRSILISAIWGGIFGGLVLGVAAYLIAAGITPIAGLGQFATGGTSPATFTGAGVGAALGALIGGVFATLRLPRH